MTFASIVGSIIVILNSVVAVLTTASVVLFMWSGVRYIYQPAGKGDKRKNLMWSFIALFVLFSVWGILRVACATFGNICTSTNAPLNLTPATGTPGGTNPFGGSETAIY